MDQLREIFDGIDVVVRRWRNERYAGLRVTQACNEACDLVTGKLAALARFSALRHLDLNFFRVREVLRSDPKATAGNLLNFVV